MGDRKHKSESDKDRKKTTKEDEVVKNPPEKESADDENDNDFGGLPERDLKKSLGCGG